MHRRGFTLVELLIVIVVIAILAAITIVAYNGITQRAKNSSTIATAEQTYKVLEGWIQTNGAYPTGNGTFCLSCPSCSFGGNAVSSNTTLSTKLNTIGALPTNTPSDGTTTPCIVYSYNNTRTYNGIALPVVLAYNLYGSTMQCGLSDVSSTGNMAMTTSTVGYTATDASGTFCLISVPGPAS